MSKTPIFDAVLLDHPDLLGTSIIFPTPPTPLYTVKNWTPAKKVEGWGDSKGSEPNPQREAEWKTFLRCLTWWAG